MAEPWSIASLYEAARQKLGAEPTQEPRATIAEAIPDRAAFSAPQGEPRNWRSVGAGYQLTPQQLMALNLRKEAEDREMMAAHRAASQPPAQPAPTAVRFTEPFVKSAPENATTAELMQGMPAIKPERIHMGQLGLDWTDPEDLALYRQLQHRAAVRRSGPPQPPVEEDPAVAQVRALLERL